jgi:hypothetical protein
MDERDERKRTSDDASKRLDDIETGVSRLLRDQRGRYLLTDHAVSGVEEA